MKKISVAINGFGRIGRVSLRALLQHPHLSVAAINDLAPLQTAAHLFKYDSTYGPFEGEVTHRDDCLVIDECVIPFYSEADPQRLPWKALQIDVVLESTGVFTSQSKASQHIQAGAHQVVLSAPSTDPDVPTVVLGVNEHVLTTMPSVLSNASCTTHCLAPMAMVLEKEFGIVCGQLTTTHAYTADQRLQDSSHKDLRRARAAAHSIIPTSTGAARAIGRVLPTLEGKLSGMAMRVPVINGSVTDLTVLLKKAVSTEAINEAMQAASKGCLRGVMAYTEDPIVSVDVIGNPHACVFDAQLTSVQGNLAKVVGWYDNEGAYAQRMVALIDRVAGSH